GRVGWCQQCGGCVVDRVGWARQARPLPHRAPGRARDGRGAARDRAACQADSPAHAGPPTLTSV
ncbi:MAG: hypothetical protein AVDCRST_MAG34-2291, partial [uncultured Nocardioidaceae bacterium]